jgi:hypothetical protein
MHYCKKIKQLLSLSLLAAMLSMFAGSAMATSNNLNIVSANLVAMDDVYVLNADVDIKFNEEIEQAIIRGFELNFITEFQLVIPQKYWFDDEIVTVTRRVTLSYHALSRLYLLTHGEQQKTFVTLDEAIDALSEISDLKVFSKTDVEKGEVYKATLLMRLDKTKLPKALQGDSTTLDEWKMTSQRFEWLPNLFK